MPAAGVELQVQRQIDHIGAYNFAVRNAIFGRDILWDMVDAAQDETYENRVKGLQITAVDVTLDTTDFGQTIRDWFNLHRTYYNSDAGLTGVTSIDTAIAFYQWRASQDFNRMFQSARNTLLTPANVFPRSDINLGSHDKTGDAFTDGVAVDKTESGPGKIMAVADGAIGASVWTLTATLVKSDLTTSSLAITFSALDPDLTEKIYGEETLTGDAASGQKVILIADTSAFSVGEEVLIQDTAPNESHGVVASIVTNVSITLVDNLFNGYTTAASAKVTPLFFDVSAITDSGTGTAGDEANLRVKPDRDIALT